jgi:hypothetical protein
MVMLRSTWEDAATRYFQSYAATRKAAHPKNNKRMKSLLEGKEERKSVGSPWEAIVDDNEEEEEGEGDTAPAPVQKRGNSRSQD